MQVEFEIKQSAIDKLMREVAKYGRRVSDEIEKETAYAAQEVRQIAVELVPVDKGILKGSIQAQKVGGFVRGSRVLRGMAGKITYLVGTNVKYARYIEFGTPIGTGPNGGPRPYLRPAYNKVAPGYARKIASILRRGGR